MAGSWSELRRAAAAFTTGEVRLAPLGSGRINDTYLVVGPDVPFVLQRLSSQVFADPELVVANFVRVSGHLRRQCRAKGALLQVAEPVPCRTGGYCHRDAAGGCWRAQSYLAHETGLRPVDPRLARAVGETLAVFHHLLADFDPFGPEGLADPLPGFHHLSGYLQECDKALAGWTGPADRNFADCLAAIDRHRHRAGELERSLAGGALFLQPVHGDPKLDNFLFGQNGQPLGLIDLDTVRPGLALHDLGDCLRSVCNPAGEGGKAEAVGLDFELVAGLLEGYYRGPGGRPAASWRGLVFAGLLQIAFELGVRFFNDHLRGDRYFKVERRGDNLDRAGNQFRLTESIVAREREIRRLAE
jgi:aminoglycoside phosphotransferase (APT) family kinase protein